MMTARTAGHSSHNTVATTAALSEDDNGHRYSVLESHGYNPGRVIGTGSYAVVKLATSERHQTHVAIKIVSRFQAPEDYLKKFLPREIEVVKGLKHPNLITFLQAVETTHRVYIVMEFASNGSLLELIRNERYIEEDPRAKLWFTQLHSAIQYCHDKGVVHRDIKCENLLLDSNFDLKLSDFGFARGHMKPRSDGQPVLSETFCGSYAYASPEILKGIPYEPQMSDVWSMGVVLYAMVFGKLPYDDTTYSKLIKQVQSKVKFKSEPKVSEDCKTLIGKMLAPLRIRLRINQIPKEPWMTRRSLNPTM